jgi:hypothetical protein
MTQKKGRGMMVLNGKNKVQKLKEIHEVLTVAEMSVVVFWAMMLCGLVNSY